MKIGIFGGTFDPVHFAHLVLAESCYEACGLDRVIFLPVNEPPHKEAPALTPGKQRLAMLEFATAGIPEFVVDPRELKRGGTSFTVDTLSELRAEFPDDELYFLMGADSLRDLMTWREPERIAALTKLVAVNREQMPAEEMAKLRDQLPESIREAVVLVEMPALAISSSGLRQRVVRQQSIRFLTPRPVERFIHEHKLYTN